LYVGADLYVAGNINLTQIDGGEYWWQNQQVGNNL
jgi:hypothetical protein